MIVRLCCSIVAIVVLYVVPPDSSSNRTRSSPRFLEIQCLFGSNLPM